MKLDMIEIIRMNDNIYTVRDYEDKTVIRRLDNGNLIYILSIKDNNYGDFGELIVKKSNCLSYLESTNNIENINLLPTEIFNELFKRKLET